MSLYKVSAVEPDGGFTNDHGEWLAWKLTVTTNGSEPEVVGRNTKVGNAAPTVGEEIEGELEPGKYRQKLVKAKKGGGSGGSWEPEHIKDPAKVARITRMHAQEMAILWTATLAKEGKLKEDSLTDTGLKRMIDYFAKDTET